MKRFKILQFLLTVFAFELWILFSIINAESEANPRSSFFTVKYAPRNGSLCFKENETIVYNTGSGEEGQCSCDILREVILIFPLALRKWNCSDISASGKPTLLPPLADAGTEPTIVSLEPVHPGYLKWSDLVLPSSYFEGSKIIPSIPEDDLNKKLWPGGIIPFTIDKQLSSATSLITQAMSSFHARTCVHFVPRKLETNYLRMTMGKGCHSLVGHQGIGAQDVSLGMGCLVQGIILHQLGHAVGLLHEHNRSDRDTYLRVEWDNVIPTKKLFLSKFSNNETSSSGIVSYNSKAFDYSSVMLFGPNAYSNDVDGFGGHVTIKPRKGQKIYDLHEKFSLSEGDVEFINKLYNC